MGSTSFYENDMQADNSDEIEGNLFTQIIPLIKICFILALHADNIRSRLNVQDFSSSGLSLYKSTSA